jgi:hypothetical protein
MNEPEAFIDRVLDLLHDDPQHIEELAFLRGAPDALTQLLDNLFEEDPDPQDELEELLRLICALEVELKSPNAASLLRVVMAAHPLVSEVLDDEDFEGFDANPDLEKWSGASDTKVAPMLGGRVPRERSSCRRWSDRRRSASSGRARRYAERLTASLVFRASAHSHVPEALRSRYWRGESVAARTPSDGGAGHEPDPASTSRIATAHGCG